VPRLVLITGASGSGKSSLMRAGIIPRLKKHPGQWLPIRPFRRGADVITEFGDALAWTFMQYKGTAAREVTAELRTAAARGDRDYLRARVRDLRVAVGSPEATMLIAIDQAEELLASNAEESANQLLYLLSDALSEADRELMAIATIRSDALGLLQQHPAVRGIEGRPELTFETFPLGPMPLDRVPEIIRGPARYIRLQIDDELVDAARADVKTPDALPLLAYTLQQLHARSGNNARLTLPAYNQLGRLEGSIRKIADESY
jgi:energy-coupling factor transporter ATP-binding protein EcfA2